MRKWHLIGRTLFVVAAAAGLAVAATFLPDNPYERFQQLDDTIYARARWSYERIHFDARPIDVAIVGDSRNLLGLKSSEIEQELARRGKQASVANLALEGDGRNQQWVFVQELLRTKNPKVIVLPVHEAPHPWGHDTFRYIASASDIRREALFGLYDARKNLMYLPYRQIRLFVARVLPSSLGVSPDFDAARYAATPADFPERHKNSAGKWIDFRQVYPRTILLRQLEENKGHLHQKSKLPAQVRAVTDADDRVYTRLIARAAAERGVKLLFVYQPVFHRPVPIENRGFYEALGPIQDNADLSERDEIYYDWSHVNSQGAKLVSDRVAAKVAELLS